MKPDALARQQRLSARVRVCACARVRVCACARVRVCVCVCVKFFEVVELGSRARAGTFFPLLRSAHPFLRSTSASHRLLSAVRRLPRDVLTPEVVQLRSQGSSLAYQSHATRNGP